MTLDDYTAIASWRGRKIADMSKDELIAVVIEIDRMMYAQARLVSDQYQWARGKR